MKERGSLMVLLSWVLVALSLIALSFSRSVRMEVKATVNEVELKQSYYIARSAAYYTINRALIQALKTQGVATLAAGAQQDIDEELDSGHLTFAMAGGQADVEITDETGKINLNLAPPDLLRGLLAQLGVNRDTALAITDAIGDWRDPDKDPLPLGAEDDYYMSLPEPYHCKDGLFDNIQELLLVKGVTPEIFYGQKFKDESGKEMIRGGLVNFLTTYTFRNQINIKSAPFEVLASIPGMDPERARQIVARRGEMKLSAAGQLGEQLGFQADPNVMSFLTLSPSNVFSLKITARLNGKRIASLIRCTFGSDNISATGYRIYYWNENNLEL
ncbi:MAG TPA: general secretion pathway protein GspK [Acidobacteriota bacterium]